MNGATINNTLNLVAGQASDSAAGMQLGIRATASPLDKSQASSSRSGDSFQQLLAQSRLQAGKVLNNQIQQAAAGKSAWITQSTGAAAMSQLSEVQALDTHPRTATSAGSSVMNQDSAVRTQERPKKPKPADESGKLPDQSVIAAFVPANDTTSVEAGIKANLQAGIEAAGQTHLQISVQPSRPASVPVSVPVSVPANAQSGLTSPQGALQTAPNGAENQLYFTGGLFFGGISSRMQPELQVAAPKREEFVSVRGSTSSLTSRHVMLGASSDESADAAGNLALSAFEQPQILGLVDDPGIHRAELQLEPLRGTPAAGNGTQATPAVTTPPALTFSQLLAGFRPDGSFKILEHSDISNPDRAGSGGNEPVQNKAADYIEPFWQTGSAPLHLQAQQSSSGSVQVPVAILQPMLQVLTANHAVVRQDADHSVFTITLLPEGLGEIRLSVERGSESKQVSIQLLADNPSVKDLLNDTLPSLQAGLEAQGIQVAKVEVGMYDNSSFLGGGMGFFGEQQGSMGQSFQSKGQRKQAVEDVQDVAGYHEQWQTFTSSLDADLTEGKINLTA